MLKWGQRVTVHVKSKFTGTRKKCEHGIFIGYDDKLNGHRVYVKRTRKILVSQHVQWNNSAKEGIDKGLSAGDDVPTYNNSDAEIIPRPSEDGLSVSVAKKLGLT